MSKLLKIADVKFSWDDMSVADGDIVYHKVTVINGSKWDQVILDLEACGIYFYTNGECDTMINLDGQKFNMISMG